MKKKTKKLTLNQFIKRLAAKVNKTGDAAYVSDSRMFRITGNYCPIEVLSGEADYMDGARVLRLSAADRDAIVNAADYRVSQLRASFGKKADKLIKLRGKLAEALKLL